MDWFVVEVMGEVTEVLTDECDDIESLDFPAMGVEEDLSGVASGLVSSVMGRINVVGGGCIVAAHERIIRTAKSTGITSAAISPWPVSMILVPRPVNRITPLTPFTSSAYNGEELFIRRPLLFMLVSLMIGLPILSKVQIHWGQGDRVVECQ